MLSLLKKGLCICFVLVGFLQSNARSCSMAISIQRFLLQYSSVFCWPDSSFSCCRSLSPAALCLWRLACKHVWQVAFICLQACVAGCFHLQWHSFSVCFYGWSLSAPLSSSCLRFPALSQIQTTKGKITCTATRNKPTCSKPEKSQ